MSSDGCGRRDRLLRFGLVFAALVWAVSAQAQVPPAPDVPEPADLVFLSRASFTFEWAHLGTDDRRFEWMGAAAFEIDVLEFGEGRVRFATEVEQGLGRERRRYDLNHGNYRFDASISYRMTPEIEIEAISQHVSRHLVDRDQVPAVSWNSFGARARYTDPSHVEGALEWSVVTQPAFVDYRWIGRGHATYTALLGRTVSAFATAEGEVMRVDDNARGASRVCGGRLEGGLRIAGRAAALELFAAYERRVDGFPTDRYRARWRALGFRIVAR